MEEAERQQPRNEIRFILSQSALNTAINEKEGKKGETHDAD